MLNSIKDKVWKRLKGWKFPLFSTVGREVLLKEIIQALLTYSMSYFKFPMKLINDLYRMKTIFWWGYSKKKKKIHWCKWTKLCKTKERGGMRFRDISTFNQVLLAKQVWRLIRNLNSLYGKVLKASYFPNKIILDAFCGSKAFYVWRSLMWGKEIIIGGYRWRIGDGNDVRILHDPWLQGPVSFKIFDKPHLPNDFFVIDLQNQDGEWDEEFIRNNFYNKDSDMILSLPSENRDLGKILWHYSKNGEYSVKSFYEFERES
ncbi:uncharacterized mitochondrial protein AtMg00310-like [Humulus lupulus]|uniref:uncharacterized mitochondrial protein AtMg00310-like n=1 Tax=Humulus lupulus TaxID=3486 RepID=UPI002B40E056|nr:uncharacterized mitochondrial protein AtMg00310-like [Humulus lupulus]